MTAQPADEWQQNADVALMQSHVPEQHSHHLANNSKILRNKFIIINYNLLLPKSINLQKLTVIIT